MNEIVQRLGRSDATDLGDSNARVAPSVRTLMIRSRFATIRPFLAGILLATAACGGSDLTGSDGGDTLPTGVDAADPESATGGKNATAWLDAPFVVLVSVDGFAARYLELYAAPALRSLAERGVWAPDGMIPVYPSKTFPNHFSLATGRYPPRHGIVANTFYDPERGATYSIGDISTVQDGTWYRGEPLWVTAERQGMVAASFFWVGTEAAVGGVRPSHWRVFDAGIPNDTRVDQVLDWLAYPAEYRPHLILLYFSTTDQVGHQFGPDSPQMAAAVASVDASLARLLTGIEALAHGAQVTTIVVSDHGMDTYPAAGVRHLSDVVDVSGLSIPESGSAAIAFVDEGRTRAVRIRDSVNAGLPNVTAFLSGEVPDRFHYNGDPRLGDLILMPDSGHVVWPLDDRPAQGGFTHGWDNLLLSMRAIFIASGPALPAQYEIEPFELIHIYPLVTRLLGLTPAAGIDGDPSFWDGLVAR